ncbi:MAG: helix-turn-helix transcriptional regulator [Gammaproteobacteria bacterium]|nr:helix-turn-helix transcriptional regulator [Gammaproteobacteria bacterium]NIR85365.1 helix-turn-helix transcriptional regulator [Gammaproteobacteria bacterium]NIR88883.1 helix-turn-helix transcriptional regulator [Gammaproteobacteria bacterium]NIU06491.1 helix-turn-helix transcriptional regulator [Gammaproteobacteria bacterium]NIV53384.1 helix-turn-helix domain-containing protein [Gammaproteobacteria bacterium]
MSVKQVAEYLQINEKKVYALASEGILPGTKITGKWLFPQLLVDQWLLESTHGGLLTDRLILGGSDDPLLHRVVARIADGQRAKALICYTGTGSQLGLRLLAARRVDAAALHWGPVQESYHRHPALLAPFVQHPQWVLVRLFHREQGLLLAPSLGGARPDVRGLFDPRWRWAFRQEGAGSQRFLKEIAAQHEATLEGLHVVAHALSEREAASCLAMQEADLAPGTRSAAREFGLAFLPMGWEAFDLVLYRAVYFRALFQALLEGLKSQSIQDLARAMGGYRFNELGRLIWSK